MSGNIFFLSLDIPDFWYHQSTTAIYVKLYVYINFLKPWTIKCPVNLALFYEFWLMSMLKNDIYLQSKTKIYIFQWTSIYQNEIYYIYIIEKYKISLQIFFRNCSHKCAKCWQLVLCFENIIIWCFMTDSFKKHF